MYDSSNEYIQNKAFGLNGLYSGAASSINLRHNKVDSYSGRNSIFLEKRENLK